MVEYIAKNLAIELMHQSSYLSDGDLLEVNGNLAKARIEAEPAADVAPVVHARWEKKKDSDLFYCSECGLPSMHKWPYCERCGSRMDGERKENCNEAD